MKPVWAVVGSTLNGIVYTAGGLSICLVALAAMAFPAETRVAMSLIPMLFTDLPPVEVEKPAEQLDELVFYPSDVLLDPETRSSLESYWKQQERTWDSAGYSFSDALPPAFYVIYYNPVSDQLAATLVGNMDCGCPNDAGTIDVVVQNLRIDDEIGAVSTTSLEQVWIPGYPQTPNRKKHSSEGGS